MRDVPPRTIKGHGKSKKEAHFDAAVQAIGYLIECGVYAQTATAQQAMQVQLQPPPPQPVGTTGKRDWDDFASAPPNSW